ncbi:FN3 domain-containing metallophosphoesterase family protein [uncultured Oscillibacter sp.]|uniref:FN3 domain-containing metallophosphoesterase family protein n=1 Tax=uncultured Oscillibacter sp. TaxID=876091 RepID=UPI00260E6CD8|nr:FN3 domain-containing metallophosphoesterase family protein [uncultured Oscillibacter sp.]
MKKAFAKWTALLLVLAMTLPMGVSAKEQKTDGWWTEEVWDTETLVSLGAKPPVYNKTAKVYEISTPEQLLFLSGAWKSADTNRDGQPDAPRDGHYVLTADIDMGPLMDSVGKAITAASGEETEGWMPPLSGNKSENADKTDGWFKGQIDGQYHTISNLRICRIDEKYAALVGYLGDETFTSPSIRNLGLADVTIEGKKTCGAFAGVSYGTIENCFATGSVKAKETTGGLVGKCEGPVRNCLSYMKVKAKELTGGLAGSIETGGAVENCFVGGSLTVSNGEGPVSGGGVAGAFAAADFLKNTVSVVKEVSGEEGAQKIDRFVGALDGESGANITHNYVWEGAVLSGNQPEQHPNREIFMTASAGVLQSRDQYEKELKWDFQTTWSWVGKADEGYPMLSGFVKAGNAPELKVAGDLVIEAPVLLLDDQLVNWAAKGTQPTVSVRLLLPEGKEAESLKVFYGKDPEKLADSVDVPEGGKTVLPLKDPGQYYYYAAAVVDGETITVPTDTSVPLPLKLDDGVIDAAPREILCQVGETYAEVNLNWLTDPAVTDSKAWYRAKGESEWKTVKGESVLHYLTKGWEETQSHSAVLTGLKAETAYEYSVGGAFRGKDWRSEVHSFTTLPESGAFTFMQYGDLQAEEPSGYDPFLNTMEHFVGKLEVQPDFLLNTGDLVDAGYKSAQWTDFFDKLGGHMADGLNILLPGNHENAGDLLYKQYGARTSLPNEAEYGPLEGTGWCVVGDACFVFINADPYSGKQGADIEADRARFFAEQTAWARKVYEEADCTWRIMAAHVGTYIVNFNDPADYPYIPALCDELQVDLYLNGHDHEYIRTTARENKVVDIGRGTTFMTSSSLGEKLDEFEEDTAGGKFAVVHKDGAENSQQIFSMVTVDEDGIHVTAYQRGVEEDWSRFDVIDQYDITVSLSKGAAKTPAAA